MKFAQFDVVKIVGISAEKYAQADTFNRRAPRIGDCAAIIDIYTDPPGYELECCDETGRAEWLMGFQFDEVELEHLWPTSAKDLK